MMNDDELVDLFQRGTAPERDKLFVERVTADVRQLQIIRKLVVLIKIAGFASFAVVLFILVELFQPTIIRLLDGLPEFMSVPLPQAVIAILCAIVVLIRRPLR